MGLDQYAYAVKPHRNNTNFSYNNDNARRVLIAEWRKHPNLEGWMQKLFNLKADAEGYEGNTEEGNITITGTNVETGEAFTLDELANNPELSEQLSELRAKIIEEHTNKQFIKERIFNQQPIRLTMSDLDQLEMAIKLGELPETTGFFFGENVDEEYKEDDLKFIEVARRSIRAGLEIYYSSWW